MSNRLFPLLLFAAAIRLAAGAEPAEPLPVRGLSIGAPSTAQVDRFVQFIADDLAPRRVNTLILRVDFNFQYDSHPGLRDDPALSRADVRKIADACRHNGIRVIPQINLLGHQSWATRTGNLLRVHPEFDETPWVKMPEKYVWPNADRFDCKSYCPLHPRVHEVVFALVDEVCEAFQADAFHAGMDEVFYIGEEKCPRCSGKDKAELFAGEVARIRDHLAARNRKLWIWGDRLLDGALTGIGEWEASLNGTHRAIDLIPKDVVICDWHYERADPTAAYFALKGLAVVTCPWKKADPAVQQVQDVFRFREQAHPIVRERLLGIVQTVWSGAGSFMDECERLRRGTDPVTGRDTAARCFHRTFAEIARLGGAGGSVPVGKPVVLYSRHFNAEGETRYLPDGTYREILGRLQSGFDVRSNRDPLTDESLAGVKVVWISNPSDQAVAGHPAPPHFSEADIAVLTRFVGNGGGLIVMGNQENHNLEVEDTNRLLANFGLAFTNRYTDIKRLTVPRDTPVLGGLTWGYYTGNSLLLNTDHPARPRALVMNDPSQKPLNGTRSEPGALLAVAEPGRGRVVAVTDAGWISNDVLDGKGIGGVVVTNHDNAEILRRLVAWAAGLNEAAR